MRKEKCLYPWIRSQFFNEFLLVPMTFRNASQLNLNFPPLRVKGRPEGPGVGYFPPQGC